MAMKESAVHAGPVSSLTKTTTSIQRHSNTTISDLGMLDANM